MVVAAVVETAPVPVLVGVTVDEKSVKLTMDGVLELLVVIVVVGVGVGGGNV